MASAGIIPGILTCFLSGAIAALGLFFLSKCAAKAPHRRSSFFAVSQMTFPKAAVLFDAAVVIKCFGVSIRCAIDPSCPCNQIVPELTEGFYYSYLIILKSLMPSVVKALYHVLLPYDPPEWALSGRIWISIFMVLLVPLCFLKSLHSLRHTSYIALFGVGMFRGASMSKDDLLTRVNVAYLVTIVVVCYISPPKGSSPPGEIHLIHFTPSFISTFPIQVFAYTCGQNVRPSPSLDLSGPPAHHLSADLPHSQRADPKHANTDDDHHPNFDLLRLTYLRGGCNPRLSFVRLARHSQHNCDVSIHHPLYRGRPTRNRRPCHVLVPLTGVPLSDLPGQSRSGDIWWSQGRQDRGADE